MTIISNVLLENSQLTDSTIEELSDLASDAILLNMADDDELDDISAHELPIDGFSEVLFDPDEY